MVRYKARYLLFNVLYPSSRSSRSGSSTAFNPKHIDILAPSDPSLTASEIATHLRSNLATQFGDWGSGVAGNLSVKYFSPATSTGIVRAGREHYRLVWAALTYVRELRGRACVVRVVHVAGTIRKAEVEAVRRARRDVGLVVLEAGLGLGDLMSDDDDEEDDDDGDGDGGGDGDGDDYGGGGGVTGG